MLAWSHYINPSDVKEGDHVYALRMFGTYQHHGIVITGEIAKKLNPKPSIIEPFMVIEQNRKDEKEKREGGLRVVTLEMFMCGHSLRRAQYNENPFVYRVKRSGSCYIKQALPPQLIVANAILIYNEERGNWSTYSLIERNCEHFAFTCSTSLLRLSEQVCAKWGLLDGALSTAAMTGMSVLFGFIKGSLMNFCSNC